MASSCCTDLSQCNGTVYSSNCVVWAANPITNYNINTGDSLTSLITTITTELDNLRSGADITLSSISLTGCSDIASLIGTNYSLSNFIQTLVNYQCTLKAYINSNINTTPVVYNTGCLTVANSQESTIIQAVINSTCTNTTSIATLTTQVNTNTTSITTLQGQVSSILGQNSSQAPVFTVSQLMVPYCPQPYIGPLTNFDSSGAGLASAGYSKVYIMNGNNGTPDWRGYAFIGAVSGVPGGSLDQRVDPNFNPGFTISPGNKIGEVTHASSINEMPSHTHTINDPGHSHNYTGNMNTSHPRGGTDTEARYSKTLDTSVEVTNITINAAGNGQPHNNIQPSVAGVWIVKLP